MAVANSAMMSSGRPLGAASSQRVREAQIELLYQFPERIFANIINAGLVAAVLWNIIDTVIVAVWLSLMCATIIIRYLLCRAFHRRRQGDDVELWAKAFLIGIVWTGVLWGVTSSIVWLTTDIFYHAFIAFVIAGMGAGGAATSYPHLHSAYGFLFFVVFPLSINYFLVAEGAYIAMGFMVLLYLLILIGQIWVAHETLLSSLRLREENLSLVDDLSSARDNLEVRVQERTHELDRANETLRAEMAARAETESRLQQAQKMESIGQLTGGIAHDFNNLLAVIQGNAELLSEAPENKVQSRELQAVLRASERGAQLTQRLLAFSRKQALQPQAINVNDLVTSMTNMLDRTLGADVAVDFVPEPNIVPALVDPGQLENAILNLAINARDAMPDGGHLTIATGVSYLSGDEPRLAPVPTSAEFKPGRYVVVSVRDTGTGIAEEILDKVWEPFFTTKPSSEGTGLGLSMVYGFVCQSEGYVSIDSTVGKGTTAYLFLPHADIPEVALPSQDEMSGMPSGSEYIFVIEDDEEIRIMVEELLTRLGYRVVSASCAEEVYSGLDEHGKPDLFLSDVVLPAGHRGPKIIAAVRRQMGPVKAIFMSGHAEGGVAAADGLKQGVVLINKPFELAYLARHIRQALDGPGD
jgi:signal transduction histidine kinase/ActR/RegA family two-component response regulator